MAFSNRRKEKQVRVAVFDNEPMARLAVQRLQQMGIPALTRCLRGGPGLWGSGYNLPHDLVVYESDEGPAREVLDLGPTPEAEEQAGQGESTPSLGIILVGAVLVVLFLVVMVSVFSRPL